jgi:hypothetical protein
MVTGISIEDGRYGRKAVFQTRWTDDYFEYLTRHNVVEIELNQAKGWTGNDLAFLPRLPHLLAFEIFDFSIRDISPIHQLRGLRRLGISTYCSTEIKFAAFSDLESCSLEWRATAESVFDCITLKHLFINRYRGNNVDRFTELRKLESLAILNAPIENLHGLASLTSLRALRLANLTKLKSLRGIEGLNLEELEIHTCRAIGSIDPIGFLPALQALHLNNDGPIASLKPLDRLSKLRVLSFYESTNVLDGDLSPLLRQRNLTRVSFQNRRHYSHAREDFGSA